MWHYRSRRRQPARPGLPGHTQSAEWCLENKPLPGLLGRRVGAEPPWKHTAGPRGRLCPPITAMAKGMPSRHLSGWSKGSWWETETLERAEREQERWEAACYGPASLPRPGEKVRLHKHHVGACGVCRSVRTCGAFPTLEVAPETAYRMAEPSPWELSLLSSLFSTSQAVWGPHHSCY